MTNGIFISYAREDQNVAESLKALFEGAYGNDWGAFCASVDIEGGDKWLDVLQERLSSCAAAIIICTPASIRKAWVLFEAGAAWGKLSTKLYPIVLSKATDKSLPPPLAHIQYRELIDADSAERLVLEISAQNNIGLRPGVKTKEKCQEFMARIDKLRAKQHDYDLFLSVPLKAWAKQVRLELLGKSETERKAAITSEIRPVLAAIEATQGLKNYYFAGTRKVALEGSTVDLDVRAKSTAHGFASDPASAQENFEALRNAYRYMMVIPGEYWTGTLFEAGYALARRIPSVYFYKRGVTLPFMVRNASSQAYAIQYEHYSDIANLINDRGAGIFPGDPVT